MVLIMVLLSQLILMAMHVTGYTTSSNFPTTQTGYDKTYGCNYDAFLIKIDTNASGNESLVYGTYIGGSGNDLGYGIKVDDGGRAYISGITNSENFPVTQNGLQTVLPGGKKSGFFVLIDTNIDAISGLLYGTYIGGDGDDQVGPLDIDFYGYVYVTGLTSSKNGFPITSTAYQPNYVGSGLDSFLIKLDPNLYGEAGLLYGSYIGGNIGDQGSSVAVDDFQNAYIAGSTTSRNGFPITSTAYKTTKTTENFEPFLVKINTTASGSNSLVYGTYLGGSTYSMPLSVAVYYNQYAYISGGTTATDFPTTENAYNRDFPGGTFSGFFMKVDTLASNKNCLKYSSYIGGNAFDFAYGVAVDISGNAYITGNTTSDIGFPITTTAYAKYKFQAMSTPFLIKINPLESGNASLLYGTYIDGTNTGSGTGIAVDLNRNAYITGFTDSTNFPTNNGYQTTLQYCKTTAFLIKLNTLVCDLVLEKSACSCVAQVGEKTAYTITVVNNGPNKATNVVVTDVLPSMAKICSYAVSTGSVTKTNKPFIWIIPYLESGQKAVAVTEVKITTSCCYIFNTASVTCDNNIVNTNKCERTVITLVNDLCNTRKADCDNDSSCHN